MIKTKLTLKNGEVFEGYSPTWQSGQFFGEVVFTTGMTGYVESLTDPSYAGQILTFTYPLIGNYGVPDAEFWESKKIHAKGVIVSECAPFESHYRKKNSFAAWLESQGVPLITDVDTRALTKELRIHGTIPGVICKRTLKPKEFIDYNESGLLKEVSVKCPETFGKGKRVIAIDCGMKENIMRSLLQFPLEVKRVPYDYDFTNEEYDGVFISNGPGDPEVCTKTIAILKKALKNDKKPIFGICLGAQLLALAIGAKTYKLKYGHRAQNQPCMHLESGKCYLTSQNHGYAIDKKLPKGWRISFTNLNDDSIEGIEHTSKPFFAVQFHPEACPGPVDTHFLFEKFYQMLKDGS